MEHKFYLSLSQFERDSCPIGTNQYLRKSLRREGMLNPLTVVKHRDVFRVVDGKKRLEILLDLHERNIPGWKHKKVPCIYHGSEVISLFGGPTLISELDFVHRALEKYRSGMTIEEIRSSLFCSEQRVKDALAFENLSFELKKRFYDGDLDLFQAASFESIPNKKAQNRLFEALKDHMSERSILFALRAGAAVIPVEDDFIIVPSRGISVTFENNTVAAFG